MSEWGDWKPIALYTTFLYLSTNHQSSNINKTTYLYSNVLYNRILFHLTILNYMTIIEAGLILSAIALLSLVPALADGVVCIVSIIAG